MPLGFRARGSGRLYADSARILRVLVWGLCEDTRGIGIDRQIDRCPGIPSEDMAMDSFGSALLCRLGISAEKGNFTTWLIPVLL